MNKLRVTCALARCCSCSFCLVMEALLLCASAWKARMTCLESWMVLFKCFIFSVWRSRRVRKPRAAAVRRHAAFCCSWKNTKLKLVSYNTSWSYHFRHACASVGQPANNYFSLQIIWWMFMLSTEIQGCVMNLTISCVSWPFFMDTSDSWKVFCFFKCSHDVSNSWIWPTTEDKTVYM